VLRVVWCRIHRRWRILQDPPFLLAQTADPPTTAIFPIELGKTYKMSVAVRSEDAGDPLVGRLYGKWGIDEPPQLLQDGFLSPSNLADVNSIAGW